MNDLNKVELIGRLTADPAIRDAKKGFTCASLRMATNRSVKDASGKASQQTEYHSVLMFGRLAKVAEKYLRKGDRLYVAGRIRTNAWAAKDGSRKGKSEIVTENLIMLGGKPKDDRGGRSDDVVVEEIETGNDGEG
jgi:single-strand DNA-binding protein